VIHIYTDGGCSGNPGPGGWAFVILQETFQGARILAENSGAEKDTTNNRMELTAVIASLETFINIGNATEKITVYTDSQYVQKGMTVWIKDWKSKGWRTSDKKPVKNQELWLRLEALAAGLKVNWVWVKGHDGNKYNEKCDVMTKKAIVSM